MGGLILFGVFLNLALFFIKDIVDDRNKLRNVLHATETLLSDAYNTVNRAYNESRLDDLRPTSNYWLSRIALEDILNEWNDAIKYRMTAETFERKQKEVKKSDRLRK